MFEVHCPLILMQLAHQLRPRGPPIKPPVFDQAEPRAQPGVEAPLALIAAQQPNGPIGDEVAQAVGGISVRKVRALDKRLHQSGGTRGAGWRTLVGATTTRPAACLLPPRDDCCEAEQEAPTDLDATAVRRVHRQQRQQRKRGTRGADSAVQRHQQRFNRRTVIGSQCGIVLVEGVSKAERS